MEYCGKLSNMGLSGKTSAKLFVLVTAMIFIIACLCDPSVRDYTEVSSGREAYYDGGLVKGRPAGAEAFDAVKAKVILTDGISDAGIEYKSMKEIVQASKIKGRPAGKEFFITGISKSSVSNLPVWNGNTENMMSGWTLPDINAVEYPEENIPSENAGGQLLAGNILPDPPAESLIPDASGQDYVYSPPNEEITAAPLPDDNAIIPPPENTHPNTPEAEIPGNAIVPGAPDGEAIVPGIPDGGVIVPDVPGGEAIVPDTPDGGVIVPDVPGGEAIVPDTPDGGVIVPDAPDVGVIVPDTPDGDGSAIIPDGEGRPDGNDADVLPVSGFRINEEGMIYNVVYEEGLVDAGGCIELPAEGCTGILKGAFEGMNSGICEIILPPNITYIENGALSDLPELSWIDLREGNSAYSSVDGVLFDSMQNTLIAFPAGRTGTYNVPGFVGRLADGSFADVKIDKLDMRACGFVEAGTGTFGEFGGDSLVIYAPKAYFEDYLNIFGSAGVIVE